MTKTVGGVTTYFLYDEATNLIGEYDQSGNVISEHIYLNGVPVGLVKGNSLYYVHTDHLGTPRTITNNANTVVWKWNNVDPFGGNLPSVATIEYNKRFPGQYFDNESKLHYNYYRTYNPLTGRYIQSDPLGLAAGFNTYSYVGSNPLGAIDPLGLEAKATMNGKNITINVPITINLRIPNNSRGDIAAGYIKQKANEAWNSQNWKYGDCPVNFNFDVSYQDKNKLNNLNIIENNLGYRSVVNVTFYKSGFVKGTNGFININNKYAPAHEIGHLMGHPDKYYETDEDTIPFAG